MHSDFLCNFLDVYGEKQQTAVLPNVFFRIQWVTSFKQETQTI